MFNCTTMNGAPLWPLTPWNLKIVSSCCLQDSDSRHLVTRWQMPEKRRQPLNRWESLTIRIAHLVLQRGLVVYPLGYITNTWTGSTPCVSKQSFFSAAAKFTNAKVWKYLIKDEIKFSYTSFFLGDWLPLSVSNSFLAHPVLPSVLFADCLRFYTFIFGPTQATGWSENPWIRSSGITPDA